MRLWELRRKDKTAMGCLKVGVLGVARGVGATHFALMLANYYANGCGLRTALVEFSGHKDYMKICDEANIKVNDIRHFSYKHIDFKVCDKSQDIALCFSQKYEVVIIDMTSEKAESLTELKRCDIKLVVGSTDMWRIGRIRKLFSELGNIPVTVAFFMGNPNIVNRIGKEYKQSVFLIPPEPDPLKISSQTMYLLKKLLA